MKRYIVGFILLVFGIYYIVINPQVMDKGASGDEQSKDNLVLTNVRIKVYDDTGRRYMSIYGRDKVFVHKNHKLLTMTPIKVVDERTKPFAVLTAHKGIRRSIKQVEQIEFTGDVFLEKTKLETLKTEKLLFYPNESIVEVPVACFITTTSATIRGDFMQTSTELRNGTVRGNVEIVRQTVSDSEGPQEAVHITGDLCPFDATNGVYKVQGNVRVVQGDFILTCHDAVYRTTNERAHARGNVAATDPDVILTCQDLDYDVKRLEVTAKGQPKAARTSYGKANDPTTMEYTELHAKDMFYRRRMGTLDAKGQVQVIRYVLDGATLKRDFEIRSDDLKAIYRGEQKQGATNEKGRSNFRGNVHIESNKVGATGERAIFYEKSRNFYVIGNAKAWGYSADGQRVNEVSGGKIYHDGMRDKNVVLEGVKGLFAEGEDSKG